MLTFAFMHHPYLVCILFGIPSLHLFTFLMFHFFSICSYASRLCGSSLGSLGEINNGLGGKSACVSEPLSKFTLTPEYMHTRMHQNVNIIT